MKSMTGFGVSYLHKNFWNLTCVVKGINSKYLEIDVFLPTKFIHLEPEVRRKIGQNVKRGKIEVKFFITKPKFIFANLFDGLFLPKDSDILQAFEKSLHLFLKSRQEEGGFLKEDIMKRIKNIRKIVGDIERMHKKFPQLVRKLLSQRINEIASELKMSVDDQTIDKAGVVHIVRKADIHEEIERIKSHIRAFEKESEKEGDGKKLLFLAQEILRELNTIGSKALDTKIIHATIQAKLEIERIREQLHNIE